MSLQQLLLAGGGVIPVWGEASSSTGTGNTRTTSAVAVSAGSRLFVFCDAVDAPTGCTDTAGNTYIGLTVRNQTGSCVVKWYYSLNVTGHPANVTTVTFASTYGGTRNLQTFQYSGALTTNEVDVGFAGFGPDLNDNTPAITTTAAGLILIGCGATSANSTNIFNQGFTYVPPTFASTGLGFGCAYKITPAGVSGLVVNVGTGSTFRTLSAISFK
jgi:hypothetical protein